MEHPFKVGDRIELTQDLHGDWTDDFWPIGSCGAVTEVYFFKDERPGAQVVFDAGVGLCNILDITWIRKV